MFIIDYFLITITLLAVIFFIWCLYCNNRTFKKRVYLIRTAPNKDYSKYSDEFSNVSYDKHMWNLIFFRDPKKLYGPLNQSIWK